MANQGDTTTPSGSAPHASGRRRARLAVAVLLAGTLAAAACSSDDSASSSSTSQAGGVAVGALPPAAQAIVDRPAYVHGSWSYDVVDAASGASVYSNQADRVNFLGSTTKTFTVGTYFDQVGLDATLETPVYAVGDRTGESLQGDLVLVGSGDFILGSRDVGQGELQFNEPDHVYYYASPLAKPVTADPLAGLDRLAAQVRDAGITQVSGDVLVDDRLWEPYESKEGVVTPIMVNDNLLDIVATPAATAGAKATLDVRPGTAYFTVVNQVDTVPAGGEADVTATAGPGGSVVVKGTLPVGTAPFNTAFFAPDPAAYARALFIEALGRAGVTVTAPVAAATGTLPAADSYSADAKVASLTSPKAEVLGRLVLKVSHNRGAETLMCLLAVKAGSKDCNAGLATMLRTSQRAGIDPSSVYLYDGEGSDPASATPAALVRWLTWASGQPWGSAFRDGMPDVAGDGSIMAKSGTSARPQSPPMPSLFVVQGEAGYMTTSDGRQYIAAVYANNATYPTVAEGLSEGAPALKDWLGAVRDAN